MDPVTLIVAALVAGAAKGLTDASAGAVGDLYGQLKLALSKRFKNDKKAEEVLADHAEDPDTYDKPLKKHLQATGADSDTQILELARSLLEKADPQGAKVGKYHVDARGSTNVLIGDHGTQHIGRP